MVFAIKRRRSSSNNLSQYEVGSWAIGLWRPKLHFEINVWNCFEIRVKKFIKTLENLPKEGKKKILVISPGFASDCVETLEEISIQGKESFEKSGGEKFGFIPCLNDNQDHIILLEHLIKKSLN